MRKLRGCGCALLLVGIAGLVLPLFGYVLTLRGYVEIPPWGFIAAIVIGIVLLVVTNRGEG